tara:strand:+ start:292 stop:705 length:414 start_codon:yes stop_codon:yes gene_type:complete
MTMKDITKRNVDVEHHGDISTTVNILNRVNRLLEGNNLKIQFKNSTSWNDNLTHKLPEEIEEKKKRFKEIFTTITLHQIEDDFDYIKRTQDIEKLKSLIKKNEEDKIKIKEIITYLKEKKKELLGHYYKFKLLEEDQ